MMVTLKMKMNCGTISDPLQLGEKYKHTMRPNVFLHTLICFFPEPNIPIQSNLVLALVMLYKITMYVKMGIFFSTRNFSLLLRGMVRVTYLSCSPCVWSVCSGDTSHGAHKGNGPSGHRQPHSLASSGLALRYQSVSPSKQWKSSHFSLGCESNHVRLVFNLVQV